jgi:hypothetical protein
VSRKAVATPERVTSSSTGAASTMTRVSSDASTDDTMSA